MNAFDHGLLKLHTGTGKTLLHRQVQQPRIHFLLDNLQSPINIGQCARVAEIYGMDLYIRDQRNLLKNLETLQTVSDFSCGAWQRKKAQILESTGDTLRKTGRVIATCLQEDAVRLHDFEFENNDLIMFGNEYDGLEPDLIARADAKVYIQMPQIYLPKPFSRKPIDPSRSSEVNQNGIPNLNVAVAAGIVAYAFFCWRDRIWSKEPGYEAASV